MNRKIYSNKGFTLAETLIALVIIGVVAALTIPNLIVKHQKEETASRLKKAYSTLQQAMNRSIADNGPLDSWEMQRGYTKEFVDKYFLPYISVNKVCGYDNTGDCAFKVALLNDKNNKIPYSQLYSNNIYTLSLNDGSIVAFHVSSSVTVQIAIDINGLKGPNVSGRDFFAYQFATHFNSNINNIYKILPQGGWGGNRSDYLGDCNFCCNKEHYGMYCSAVIMLDNWQIKDDYPW